MWKWIIPSGLSCTANSKNVELVLTGVVVVALVVVEVVVVVVVVVVVGVVVVVVRFWPVSPPLMLRSVVDEMWNSAPPPFSSP